MHMRTLKGHCRTALALAITVAVNVAWQLQLYGAAAAGTVIHMGLGAGTRIIATDAGALHVASPATVAGSTTLPHTALPSHGDSLSSVRRLPKIHMNRLTCVWSLYSLSPYLSLSLSLSPSLSLSRTHIFAFCRMEQTTIGN